MHGVLFLLDLKCIMRYHLFQVQHPSSQRLQQQMLSHIKLVIVQETVPKDQRCRMYVPDPSMCDCEVCRSRRKNLPPKPELKPCKCGNTRLAIMSGSIVAAYSVECPECFASTKYFTEEAGVHGVTLAAEAWNRGEAYF